MVKLVSVQSSFSSGQLSPLMVGRTTIDQYKNGAQDLTNMVVLPQGGVTKRPGTTFVREVKTSADTTILIPFIVGAEQSYILEIGDLYVRFFRNGGILLGTTAVTNGTFDSDLTGWTDNSSGTGTIAQTGGLMRLAGGAGGDGAASQALTYMGTSQYTLTFTNATNTCTYNIGTTDGGTEIATGTCADGVNNINFTPATAGTVYIEFSNTADNNADIDTVSIDTPVYQLDAPWAKADIDKLQYAATKDIMYFAHGDYDLRKLRRFGASQWDIVTVDLVDGPYYSKTHGIYGGVGSGTTLDPSATTGSVTVVASADLFVSTDVGRAIRYRNSASEEWSELTITAYASATSVTADVQKTLEVGHAASTEWRLGALSATTGYAATVAFHEQRLVLANSSDQPQTIWFSRAGDIEIFQPDNDTYNDEVDATSAMTYTIASRDTNDIVWLSSRGSLFLGTKGSIFTAKASQLDEALTPTNISIKPTVNASAHDVMPLETTQATLYIHRHQRKVMELAYNIERDSVVDVDLSLLAEDLGAGQFKQIVQQQEPYNIIWSISELGALFGLTYLRDQNVVAWHSHTIGGTDVLVKSIAVIPGTEESELWMIVSRTIDGNTVQYVEYLSQYFRSQIDLEDTIFVDSSINYTGSDATAMTGLEHLEGEAIQAFSDGYVAEVAAAVSSGAVTLGKAAGVVQMGLGYNTVIETMPVEAQGPVGTLQGSLVRGWKAFIRLYRSAILSVGYDSSNTDIIETFGDNYVMGNPIPLLTEIKEIAFPRGTELVLPVYITQSSPTPLTVLTVGLKIIVDDDR